jgi:gamma-glutamylcyclotransferase (GGCT)/AIG2-like uncharacterized protein YtfP
MHSSRVVLNDNLMRGLSDHGLLKKDHATLVRSSVRTRDRAFLFVESSMGFPYTIDASDAPANAEWVAKERCAVRGELWVCNASVMAQLDWYHGVPTVCQRKLVALQGESEPAIMYFLKEQRTIGEIVGDRRKYRSVQPLGDWRAYLPASSKAALESAHTTLPQTKISTLLPGPHAVFSYGSNGVQQMRTRLENPKLQFRPAILPNFLRIFCGSAKRWDNGGVASVVPMPGWEVKGNIAYLSDDELRRLDRFEGTPRDDPYALTARYRRQDVHVLCEIDGQIQTIDTVVYVKNNPVWIRPPSKEYVAACQKNICSFWPAELVEVRDGRGLLRGGVGTPATPAQPCPGAGKAMRLPKASNRSPPVLASPLEPKRGGATASSKASSSADAPSGSPGPSEGVSGAKRKRSLADAAVLLDAANEVITSIAAVTGAELAEPTAAAASEVHAAVVAVEEATAATQLAQAAEAAALEARKAAAAATAEARAAVQAAHDKVTVAQLAAGIAVDAAAREQQEMEATEQEERRPQGEQPTKLEPASSDQVHQDDGTA